MEEDADDMLGIFLLTSRCTSVPFQHDETLPHPTTPRPPLDIPRSILNTIRYPQKWQEGMHNWIFHSESEWPRYFFTGH